MHVLIKEGVVIYMGLDGSLHSINKFSVWELLSP